MLCTQLGLKQGQAKAFILPMGVFLTHGHTVTVRGSLGKTMLRTNASLEEVGRFVQTKLKSGSYQIDKVADPAEAPAAEMPKADKSMGKSKRKRAKKA